MKKRILSILLLCCMLLTLLPTAAFAADTGKAIQLGTDALSNPPFLARVRHVAARGPPAGLAGA